MLFKWDFFKNSNPIFFDEGPRSFFEYEYHGIRIILIGECLSSLSGKHPMPAHFKTEFITVFNHWMERCFLAKKKALVISEHPDIKESETPGFMDCILQIKMPEGFKLIKSDARIMEDAFNEFGSFLYAIDRICREITAPQESMNLKSISCKTLWNQKPLIDEIKMLSSSITQKMYLEDMERHLQKQADLLEDILNQTKEKYSEIAPYMTECHHAISKVCFKAFEELTNWCKKREILHESLDMICIHMIEKYENLAHLDTWSELLCVDMTYSLNAILIAQLWNEMNSKNPKDFIFLIAGLAHIEALSELLDARTKPLHAFSIPNDKDASISPTKLEEMLTLSLPKDCGNPCVIQ